MGDKAEVEKREKEMKAGVQSREKEVDALLQKKQGQQAIKVALQNPPFASKKQEVKVGESFD